MRAISALARTLSFFVLLAIAGCSSSGTWRQVETAHFVLRTDLDQSDALYAGKALEETRDALISAAWPNFPFRQDERTVVFVLSNGLEFERYFGRLIDGIFFHSSPPMAFLYGSASRWELRRTAHQPTNSTLRHEMAHELAAKVYPTQPRWFAEGLAQFLEAIYYSEDEKSVVLGGVNRVAYADYRTVRRITVGDTIKWSLGVASLAQSDAVGLYGTSWFLFHWLYNTQPDAFGRYQDALASSGASAAFETAFPKFDADKADRELYEYMRHGQFQEFMLPLVKPGWSEKSFTAHVLSPEELGDLRRTLDQAGKAHQKKPKKEEARIAELLGFDAPGFGEVASLR
jgi:Protein of unknown function (DUF1570)